VSKPQPGWGAWRNEVVRHHARRDKAVAKDAELSDQLRELEANEVGKEITRTTGAVAQASDSVSRW
jgi:hypothetical protein